MTKKAENMNIYQRLMLARIAFSKKKIKPSGYNQHGDFWYLELGDIVPVANEVLLEHDLMLQVTFTNSTCTGVLWDISATGEGEEQENSIVFEIPHIRISDPSKSRMNNEIQALGAEMTYLRRYMYQIVLDIAINDSIDADDNDAPPVVKPAEKSAPAKAVTTKATPKKEAEKKATTKVVVSSKTPATPEKREEIKKEITASESPADELQINALKTITSEWVHLVPEDKPKATELLVKTNGFADCTKKEADALLDKLKAKVESIKNKE